LGEIWSEEAGHPDAPLVALIHGTMDRSTGMLRLSRQLDDRFRVLRYDRRGYGRSVHEGPFAMGGQVDDLVALLGGRRAVLIGHSYGGNVALATAERHPALVAAVGVYETPLSWEPWWPGTTAGGAARAPEGSPADAAERFMRRMVGDELWERLPERTRETRRAEGPALVGELRDLADERPWTAAGIACPLLVSHGSRGADHHRDGMRFVRDAVRHSELVVLADSRHDAPLSNAKLFAERVVEPVLRAAGPPWSSRLE
jgi:pimeloyl-ACP methyl ester carboxylesterase